MWESSISEVSICYMYVCMLAENGVVTSYICKGDGSIEEVGQSKLGVAYDGTCTNVMHPHIRHFVVSVPEFRKLYS